MQQFKSIKKIQLTIVNLILVGFVSADPIGSIVEQSGSTQIKRQQEQIKITDEVPVKFIRIQFFDFLTCPPITS